MVNYKEDKKIFISHSSLDREFADIIVDFLTHIGISSNQIFCSSIQGNGIEHIIDEEIRMNFNTSEVHIILLSKNYYNSTYCLNEQGIIWYLNKKIIVFALPDIKPENMLGFIDKNYISKYFIDENTWLDLYDDIKDIFFLNLKTAKINAYAKKAISESKLKLSDYNTSVSKNENVVGYPFKQNFLNNELVIIYYAWLYKTNKITTKLNLEIWLHENEIYDLDVYSGIDFLVERKLLKQENNQYV